MREGGRDGGRGRQSTLLLPARCPILGPAFLDHHGDVPSPLSFLCCCCVSFSWVLNGLPLLLLLLLLK